jgi:hypothetical protein
VHSHDMAPTPFEEAIPRYECLCETCKLDGVFQHSANILPP